MIISAASVSRTFKVSEDETFLDEKDRDDATGIKSFYEFQTFLHRSSNFEDLDDEDNSSSLDQENQKVTLSSSEQEKGSNFSLQTIGSTCGCVAPEAQRDASSSDEKNPSIDLSPKNTPESNIDVVESENRDRDSSQSNSSSVIDYFSNKTNENQKSSEPSQSLTHPEGLQSSKLIFNYYTLEVEISLKFAFFGRSKNIIPNLSYFRSTYLFRVHSKSSNPK